jgi:hypothetical protein
VQCCETHHRRQQQSEVFSLFHGGSGQYSL